MDLIPKYFRPCKDYENLCPGCRVFGWVHSDPLKDIQKNPSDPLKDIQKNPLKDIQKKVAYKGRVNISNARIVNEPEILSNCPITLSILSAPKPTTEYFYLLDEKTGNPRFKVKYDDISIIRGRKAYRHHSMINLDDKEYIRPGNKKDKQSRELRDVLSEGREFKFFIEFNNLAPKELGALLWTIELEENMYHRLGLAKPYGFGSVQISIKSLHILDFEKRYSSFENDGWELFDKKKIIYLKNLFISNMKELYGPEFSNLDNVKDLKAILSEDPKSLPIHYPRLKREGKNFEWFEKNEREWNQPLALATEDHGLPTDSLEAQQAESEEIGKRKQGTVKKFNSGKGYGFINIDRMEEDAFVHISDVKGNKLFEGQRVSFKIIKGQKGPKAIEVEEINQER